MSKRATHLLVEDILESAFKIIEYTQDLSFEQFSNDTKTIDAVIRNFEIIGEAANRLPQDFKDKYNSVDWHRIIGFRNRIVHDYFGIDYSIVWQIKQTFLSVLIDQLKQITH
jgi:uncharacterized protein with HEPN domain